MEITQNLKMFGVYKITKAKLVTPEQFALNEAINNARALGNDYMPMVRRLNAMCETDVIEIRNLIPTVGRTALADFLTNASPSPSTLRINYGALGSNATAPANSDTQLGTETYRNAVASQTKASNIAYVSLFFSATETSGTYREVGLFIAGTASANSGTMFSHAAISITKSVTETLTIDYTITIS